MVVGILDMGYLTYASGHEHDHRVNHALVVLALQEDTVIVHNPAWYVVVSLPVKDFLEAWKRDIYIGKPYGLWQIGEQGTPTEDEIWERTLARAIPSHVNQQSIHKPLVSTCAPGACH